MPDVLSIITSKKTNKNPIWYVFSFKSPILKKLLDEKYQGTLLSPLEMDEIKDDPIALDEYKQYVRWVKSPKRSTR